MGKITQGPIKLPGGKLVFPSPSKPARAQSPDVGGGFWRALFGLAILDPFNWRADSPRQDERDE